MSKPPHETRQERDQRILAERAERDRVVLGTPAPAAVPIHRPGELPIGFDVNDVNCYVNLDARRRHELIVGLSGTGKSRAMEHRIRHDIQQGHGLCVIDPKGNSPDSVFNNTLRWLHAQGYCGDDPKRPKRTVRIIDLSSDTHVTGLNPFHVPPEVRQRADPRKIAEDLVSVFEAVWRKEFLDTPLIYRLLPAIFVGLYEHQLTLADVPHLFGLAFDQDNLRTNFIRGIAHDLSRINLQAQHELTLKTATERQYDLNLLGPLNRLEPFIGSRVINRMFSGGGVPLDIRRIMDDGEILLCNLGTDTYNVSQQSARLVGTYLVHEFYRLSKNRQTKPRRQFFCYIDEAASFLTDEVSRALDECRSEGLSFILALQRLEQAKRASDDIYSAVLAEPNVVSVFGGLEMDEAETIARNIVKFDLERPIQATIKPAATGEFEIVELRTSGTSQTDNLSYTDAITRARIVMEHSSRMRSGASHRSFGDISSSGQSVSTILDAEGNPIVVMNNVTGSSAAFGDMTGWGEVEGLSHGASVGESFAATRGTSTGSSAGINQALKPLFADMVHGVHSIQNVQYAAAYEIRTQLPRHFFLSVDRQNAIRLAVPTITAPPLSDKELAAFKRSLFDRDAAALPIEDADANINQRRIVIERQVTRPKSGDEPIGRRVDIPVDISPLPYQPRSDELDANVVPLRPRATDTGPPPEPPSHEVELPERIDVEAGETGHTYDDLFGFMFAHATTVTLNDRYILDRHQRRNLREFLITIDRYRTHAERTSVSLLTRRHETSADEQLADFERLRAQFEAKSIDLSWDFDEAKSKHSRFFVVNDHLRATLDRGLDIFQMPTREELNDGRWGRQRNRRCHDFHISFDDLTKKRPR